MSDQSSIPDDVLPRGTVRSEEGWAVGRTPSGEAFAVSRRCRHQLADLAHGSVDADGCLVCPWHQARYDVSSGEMVSGPQGVFGYHRPTPRYGRIVRAYARWLRLSVGRVVMRQGRLRVDR